MAAADAREIKKRKLSTEDRPAAAFKVEDEEDTQSEGIVDEKAHCDNGMVINLPNVDRQPFELFLKFAYMGYSVRALFMTELRLLSMREGLTKTTLQPV